MKSFAQELGDREVCGMRKNGLNVETFNYFARMERNVKTSPCSYTYQPNGGNLMWLVILTAPIAVHFLTRIRLVTRMKLSYGVMGD